MIGTRNIRFFSVLSVFSSQIVEFGSYQRVLESLISAALLSRERMPPPVLSNADFNRFPARPITRNDAPSTSDATRFYSIGSSTTNHSALPGSADR